MRIVVKPSEIEEPGQGLAISIPGYRGNLAEPDNDTDQVYIEFYKGKLLIQVWNGTDDPTTFELQKIG